MDNARHVLVLNDEGGPAPGAPAVPEAGPPALGTFGAVAYDQVTGRYGLSWNEATQQRAVDLAMKDCASPKCASYPVPPRRCAALATAENLKESNAWGLSIRENKPDAEAQAVADCKKHTESQCKVRGSECNR
jgi:hypothetical protein